LSGLGNLEAAHHDQAEAIRISPQQALAMSEINLSFYENYLDWAQDYYGWVLAKFPKEWLAYLGRADAFVINHQPQAALPDYYQALKLRPKEALLYLRRGRAHQVLGNREQAAQDFRQALAWARKTHLRRRAEQLLAETEPAA